MLRQRGYRVTPQRLMILDAVCEGGGHTTAEEVYRRVQAKSPSINLATVYRTLPLLTESGLVREMDFGKEHKIYDPNYAEHPHHNHIICEDCQQIVEFESEQIELLRNEISQRLGFAAKSHRLQITASCEEFKKWGECKRRL